MGRKRTSVDTESFGVTLPVGVYREMIELIEREKRWDGRVEFTREAIREKLERHRRKLTVSEDAAAVARSGRL